jgi:hypothetical protein
VGVAVLAIVALGLLLLSNRPVAVPRLIGLTQAAANKRLKDAGLVLVVKGTELSSDIPQGDVSSQEPTAGLTLSGGSLVVVLLSAGPGTFPVPDVIGMTLEQATTAMKGTGLVIESDTAPSVSPSGTIIDSVPGPGELVTSGDTVHLTIATSASLSIAENLSGNSFVIDPAPPAYLSGQDVAFDVASRLAELLRMAGASVTITRGSLGSADMPGVSTRAAAAAALDATAVVGFTIGTDSVQGLQIASVPSSDSSIAPGGSAVLADAISLAFASDFSTVSTTSIPYDAVLSGSGHPAVRVRLGSTAVRTDVTSFADPDWAQRVAHDVYAGLAAIYARTP